VSDYIKERLAQSLQLRDLAGVTRLSSSHFSRAFKGSFGQTPHTYIVQQRVTRARHEMLNTRAPLSEIAIACGFADQAHLARMFHREVGMAPNRWRRANFASV
jgi:AraC-like DNA-binding protein